MKETIAKKKIYNTEDWERKLIKVLMTELEVLANNHFLIDVGWMTSVERKFILEALLKNFTATGSLSSRKTIEFSLSKVFKLDYDNGFKRHRAHIRELDELDKLGVVSENIECIISSLVETDSADKVKTVLEDAYLELENGNIEDAIETIALSNLNIGTTKKALKPMKNELPTFINKLGKGDRRYIGIETGIDFIDQHFSGLNGLILVGGGPGAGKTALVSQMSCGAAELGTPVLFVSFEMGKDEIIGRNLCRYSNVPLNEILVNGKLHLDSTIEKDHFDSVKASPEIQKSLMDGMACIKRIEDNYYIRTFEDAGNIGFTSIYADIQTIKKIHGKNPLIIIDQLQSFPVDGKFNNPIDRENYLINSIKKLQTSCDVTVLLLSHQNKQGLKKRGDKDVTDIMGSMSITHTPDVVMILTPTNNESPEMEYDARQIDLHIVKFRNGRCNDVLKMDFTGKFFNFEERQYSDED